MHPDIFGFKNVKVEDGVAVGGTPVRLGGIANRSALLVANPRGEHDVYLKLVEKGSQTPSIADNDWHLALVAGDSTSFLGMSASIDVYAWAAAETTINVVEVAY
jgi:hypothetical protein